MEQINLTLNIKDNKLSGNIDDVVLRTGEILLKAFDIIASSCMLMRRIFYNLELRNNNLGKIIEKNGKPYIIPVMDVYLHPEALAMHISEIFKQIDPLSQNLFYSKFNFNKLSSKQNLWDNLKFAQKEIFIETARSTESICVSNKINELKTELKQLEKLWNDENFQKIKTILINDCNLARKKTKSYINFIERELNKASTTNYNPSN